MKSFSTEDLFAAARADVPSEEAAERIWNHVSAATAVPAGAAVGTAAAKAGTASTTAYGVVLSVIVGTIGVAAVVHSSGAFDRPTAPIAARAVHAVAAATPVVAGAKLEETPPRPRAEIRVPSKASPSRPSTESTTRTSDETSSSLGREALLVTAARDALVGDDAAQALSLLREARALETHALEPERIRLEARALRRLGRADEALATELELRRRVAEQTPTR